MNPISTPVAQSIVLCYDNIRNSKVITTQTFDDSYTVDNVIVNRKLAIASRMCKGRTVTSFSLEETYPDRVVERIHLDDIDAVAISGDKLGIGSMSYTFMVDIAPVQPEPQPEVPQEATPVIG